jgi:hypothetical protein
MTNDAHDNEQTDREMLARLTGPAASPLNTALSALPPLAGLDYPEGPYRVDMTDDERAWASNGMEYPDPDAAAKRAAEVFWNWLGAKDWRVVPVSTPRNEPWTAERQPHELRRR